MQPFHLAIPVDDLKAADAFYAGVLGCPRGRRSEEWIDYDFYGHQLVAHLAPEERREAASNAVDGHDVPVRHFGIVMAPAEWRALADRLKRAGVGFLIEPTIRFKGEPGEQGTFFIKDPAGNALEFKCFERPEQLFAT
jgi:hypothetical protein